MFSGGLVEQTPLLLGFRQIPAYKSIAPLQGFEPCFVRLYTHLIPIDVCRQRLNGDFRCLEISPKKNVATLVGYTASFAKYGGSQIELYLYVCHPCLDYRLDNEVYHRVRQNGISVLACLFHRVSIDKVVAGGLFLF